MPGAEREVVAGSRRLSERFGRAPHLGPPEGWTERGSLAGAAHLWLADASGELSSRIEAKCLQLMSDEERRRAGRFKVDEARKQFLIGRMLVRQTLSRYVGVAPEEWRFRTNDCGRPEIDHGSMVPASVSSELRFNLSHTRGLVACVVTEGVEAGVDVECAASIGDPTSLAADFFARAEVEALRIADEVTRPALFRAIWTLKEAFIKAKGDGLSIGLSRFSFSLDEPGVVRVRFAADLQERESDWQFALFRPSNRHALALAFERAAVPDLKLQVFEVSPGSAEAIPRSLHPTAVSGPKRSDPVASSVKSED